MHLVTGLTEASDAMMVTPPSPDQASVFSMCFLGEFTNYDLLMDPRYGTNGVTSHDAYINEMDMMGIDRILDAVPQGPHSSFDLFEVFVLETDGATLYYAFIDEMDMIGTCRIFNVAPRGPRL